MVVIVLIGEIILITGLVCEMIFFVVDWGMKSMLYFVTQLKCVLSLVSVSCSV